MASRILGLLPEGWFGDTTPVLDSVLQALGTGLAAFWTLLQTVISQTRIATATGSFLDQISQDFFGAGLPRFEDEVDMAYRTRIMEALLRPRATRAALTDALFDLTGRKPAIFEPARTTDTGGYRIGGVGYGVGGGWGSLALPYQFFLTVYRPLTGGIPQLAGYSSPGIPVYGSLAMEVASIPDSLIDAAVPPLLPAGTIAWMNISN